MKRALSKMRALWAALLVMWFYSDIAMACVAHRSLDLNLVQNADIVVVGTLQDYSPPTYQVMTMNGLDLKVPKGRRYALFRIEVLEVLKGQAPKELEVVWYNETFGFPSALPATPSMIALTLPGSPFLEKEMFRQFVNPDDTSKAVVLQGSCSDAFIFSETSKEADQLRKLIGGRLEVQ